MILVLKCAVACCIMICIHFIGKTSNYYLSALLLSFPGLSILAYYFMAREHGAEKVRTTSAFALCSVTAFAIFLLSLNLLLKRRSVGFSLAAAFLVWLFAALLITLLWKKITG